MIESMKVTKRNGKQETVSFDKIISRLNHLCCMNPKITNIDPIKVAQKACSLISDKIKTSEIDELTAKLCIRMITENVEYGILAKRIIISNNHKNTSPSFSETIEILYNMKNTLGERLNLISEKLYQVVNNNKQKLNSVIDYTRDYNFDYFAYKTLEKAYLIKEGTITIERIQHLLMRVSLGIHGEDIKAALETYDYMSQKYFIHATPTLFHAGTSTPSLLSCFLLGIEDSVHGIYKCLSDCAKISKLSGGIGFHCSNIRGNNSLIKSSNGRSSGIVPMLKVFNDTARHINQGGKRLGSFAVYLEPWHVDILDFLELKKNHGDENARARDLFYSVYIPDSFMKAVKTDDWWYICCPNECRGLADSYGSEFEKLYQTYIDKEMYREKIKAREIWHRICLSQIETGVPYIVYKDHVNNKTNQMNVGVIKSSNLCTEILEYSDHKEYACCTLGSLGLPNYISHDNLVKPKKVIIYSKPDCIYCKMAKMILNRLDINFKEFDITEYREQFDQDMKELEITFQDKITVPQIIFNDIDYVGGYKDLSKRLQPTFDYHKLGEVTRVLTRNLNKIVDINHYPVPETEISNKKHRPLGIGVQGLADVYNKMRLSFDAPESFEINRKIFATIYYFAMKESVELAKKEGVYKSYQGSPISKGQFQFDLWNQKPISKIDNTLTLDWEGLRKDILQYGVRNSLLLAPMPTASTSQILGNNECIEPYTSNIYVRRTLSGDFTVINKYLLKDLKDLNIWSKQLKDLIVLNRGSIQNIEQIPKPLQKLYKTSWDLSQKVLIDQAADRGIYICQSQSLNLFLKEPNVKSLSSMHFYTWQKGLKTGIYYLRTQPVVNAQQFTIDPKLEKEFIAKLTEKETHDCCSA